MVDVNTLIEPPNQSLKVMEGDDINDRGEIADKALLLDGNVHASLLVPNGECEDECEARIAASRSSAADATQPNLLAKPATALKYPAWGRHPDSLE